MSNIINLRAQILRQDDTIIANTKILQVHDIATDAQSKIKILDKTLTLAKEEMKSFMGAATEMYAKDGSELATYREQRDERVDSKLLKEMFPHIYEQVLKVQTIRKFLIK